MKGRQPYPANFETYEQKRTQLAKFAKEHYVREFELEPGTLLDAGCGEGFWADVFTDFGFSASGFDYEPAYIANGRIKYPRVVLEVADLLDDLPYEVESFDVVFARAVSFFYAYRLGKMEQALGNLLPLVSYGGIMLISIYSDDSGAKRPGIIGDTFWHHRHETYVNLAEKVGVVTHTASKGNYLQIGIRP